MRKLFVVSDIHGHCTLLQEALAGAGYDRNCEDHWLLGCGDYFDRGTENAEVLRFLERVPRKILIRGNHDRFLSNFKAKNALAAVKDYDEINVTLEDGSMRRCVLSHYFIPMYNGHRYQGIHLHGHSHFSDEADYEIDLAEQLNAMGVQNEIYNVGCMYWNYEPVTLDEIIRHGRTIRPNYGSRCEEGERNDCC